MNANQIVNMIVRMLMRRFIRSGVDAGINAMGKRMNRDKPSVAQGNGPNPAETTKRAQQTIRMARRLR